MDRTCVPRHVHEKVQVRVFTRFICMGDRESVRFIIQVGLVPNERLHELESPVRNTLVRAGKV